VSLASPQFIPALTTDAEAEAFLAQDLWTLDVNQFKPVRFEALPKSARDPKRHLNP
jgi:predicted DNA binding CopG/RHH family protein